MVNCPSCGTENKEAAKFCHGCGMALGAACAACGAPYEPGHAFCEECGARLGGTSVTAAPRPAAAAAQSPRQPPAAERRLVSVLFADLVGFTTLSERRDAEEVRELLSSYFERCRVLVERYGGVVEKFIGDAVMAVWGTPVAQEDDAERAVRAALDLVAAVEELGAEAGAPQLQARVGVLTGEAAVTLGAEGQGMVAGDLVNTASRIQAAARPGTVLVGEATKRATEAAIAYAEAGAHELKGKAEPVPLLRALRVTASRGGALKAAGLEPPFVGRERELRLLKELYHSCAEEQRAQLVSVVGIAGIGKSRLAWEFEKYIDGLVDEIWWHRGRCLAYGEGVTYWALAEMVRMRGRIAEGEPAETARVKLRGAVEVQVADQDEREWIEPRLAQLLGLADAEGYERDDLFAAWRLFFERMSETGPLVMVFEDMQWADASLLEFVAYLLDWSKAHPIFVLVLARPELQERHPGALASGRSTSVPLEPLGEAAMRSLLSGLVPGLPDELLERILARAEGVPLYAVETVRMLLDRGLLARERDAYRLTGPVEALEVPETLQALVAARLDGLPAEERRLLQDAAVLGKTFTPAGLTAVNGSSAAELELLLTSLVRKEVFFVQADPRSPERGQYGFLQDLLRRVAYETLALRDRKARHLAAAAYLEQAFGAADQEIVEVVSAHYLAAYGAAPQAGDADEIRAKAQALLGAAGERAASLGASEEAERYFLQAAELADDPLREARLLTRAGEMAWAGGRLEPATAHLERALALFEAQGETHAAARVHAHLGEVTWAEGQIDRAVERMEAALATLSGEAADEQQAALAAQLGRLLTFMGKHERAVEWIEHSLSMAESLWLPEVLSQALNTKSVLLLWRGRPEEAFALLKRALELALEHGIHSATMRAYFNLADGLYYRDHYEASLDNAQAGLALTRRMGNRNWEWNFVAALVSIFFLTGEWDEALARAEEVPHLADFAATRFAAVELAVTLPQIHVARGRSDEARAALEPFEPFARSADIQERSAYEAAQATVLRSEGRLDEALASASAAFAARSEIAPTHPNVKLGFVEAAESAFARGDLAVVERLLSVVAGLGAGETSPYLTAHAARFRARLAAARGQAEDADPAFRTASSIFREFEMPFWLAVCEVEHAEWLAVQGRAGEAAAQQAEARATFARLEAAPWLERAEQLGRHGIAVT